MTKGELRRARKTAVKAGQPLSGDLSILRNSIPSRRTIKRRNERARQAQRRAAETAQQLEE